MQPGTAANGRAVSLPPVPERSFTHAVAAAAGIETAWRALQDEATWGAVGGVDRLWDAVHDANGELRSYRFAATAGREYEGTAEVVDSVRPERMTVGISTSELDGQIAVTLRPVDQSHTEVAVTLGLRSKGWLSTALFPVVTAAVGSGLPANVENFARRIEATAG